MAINVIEGGVCAPIGFLRADIYSGIAKNSDKKDLVLIYSKKLSNAAATYTANRIKAAPITVTRDNLSNGRAQAIICNSGNANSCNKNGIEVAKEACALIAKELKIAKSNVIVASTGSIGKSMSIDPITASASALVSTLKDIDNKATVDATMQNKDDNGFSVSFEIGGQICRIGGTFCGSNMSESNNATRLVFITTDCDISSELLSSALEETVRKIFSMLSISDECSTNDMIAIMANGMSKNPPIAKKGKAYSEFTAALNSVSLNLCKKIAADSAGATKLIACSVIGAKNDACAKKVAKSVVSSSLVKCAMFSSLADWGRIITAVGCTDTDVDVSKLDISFVSGKGEIPVCYGGVGVNFSLDFAKEILSEDEVTIVLKLGDGCGSAVAYGCDLSYDFVKMNSI